MILQDTTHLINDKSQGVTPHYRFTVFTPTYNRGHTLYRVYESLARQTFRDFEWLIVDDGSTDDTASRVVAWQAQADFPIRYIFQPNRGKHMAFNHGVKLAGGELFLTLDSDDGCVPHALERLNHHWQAIPAEQRSGFSAVTSSCMDEFGQLVGSPFPAAFLDSNSIEIRYRYRVRGEKWGFHRTEVLRRFPFPEVEGERFITEALIWRAIARQYRTRYVNEILRIYYTESEAPAGRLTHEPAWKQARGRMMYCQSILEHDLSWFRFAPLEFIKVAGNYTRNALHSDINAGSAVSALTNIYARVLTSLALPLGIAVFWRDLLEEKREKSQVLPRVSTDKTRERASDVVSSKGNH